MKIVLISTAIALVSSVALAASHAEMLNHDDIEKTLSNATIDGDNAFGNPYRVTFHRDGSIEGVAGANNEFPDTGKWWVDGNQFYRQYKNWFDGKVGCYGVSRSGRTLRFHGDDGATVSESRLSR